MQKIYYMFFIVMIMMCGANATTMCAANDTLAIVLDPQVAGTNHASNAELFEWNATFSYGTLFGIATCVTTPSGAATDTLIDTDSGDVATGGERTGKYCWCQMTHPVKSRWVFRLAYGSVSVCRSICASICGSYVRGDSSFRGGLFGSVGN
ncbi:MAG: hypothetical protein NC311_00830 [Muribaculaceae bacterium]|nr:hypothetical protein [Muribaculaceae bacterium]